MKEAAAYSTKSTYTYLTEVVVAEASTHRCCGAGLGASRAPPLTAARLGKPGTMGALKLAVHGGSTEHLSISTHKPHRLKRDEHEEAGPQSSLRPMVLCGSQGPETHHTA